MFLKNISIIYRHSAMILQKELKEPPLNNTEQSILLFLNHNNGVNQNAIAVSFQFNKTTVTKTLALLEDFGLIRRETNCVSKREKCVFLTEEGRKVLIPIQAIRNAYEEKLLEDFTEEERQIFDQLSEKIASKAWALNHQTVK
ncbi:MAG: MarR family transcriptional regulator [Eubacterium sp.]